ncbi:prokaryotic transcription elongation factor, GreA/GreB domain protein [Adhaeribacter aerolatus]|uniref:Prokaryotic transcription elongation factor, GreA/GreB domain protein n=1 Tax=Adhaeribacter aerolatus TaxID=670289 RepID=A0A512AYL8_9BACT|nr:nucleoside diphosphate kinase regulator [Adhaeribacter aerolatus]GEO04800.1 prokaryotic transcription elongation factor, GreA/GreB domain protein [Adhaeribacter aerolatus]
MKPIYLTDTDYQRLHHLVKAQRTSTRPQVAAALGKELERAQVVPSEEIPPNVITMNSKVRIKEMKSTTEMEITIVYPKDADLREQKVSILAPVGTAVLGCQVGDEVEWLVPDGTRIYKIEEVIYQPQSEGELSV